MVGVVDVKNSVVENSVVDVKKIDGKVLFELTPKGEEKIITDLLWNYFELSDEKALKILDKLEKKKVKKCLIKLFSEGWYIEWLTDESKFETAKRFADDLFERVPEVEAELIKHLILKYLYDNSEKSLKLLNKLNKRNVRSLSSVIILHEEKIDYVINSLTDKNKFKIMEEFVENLRDGLKERIKEIKSHHLVGTNLINIEKFSDCLGLNESEKKKLIAKRFKHLFRSAYNLPEDYKELSDIIDKYPKIATLIKNDIDKKIDECKKLNFSKILEDGYEVFIRNFASIRKILTRGQLRKIQNIILTVDEKSLRKIIKSRIDSHRAYIKDLISLLPKRLRDEFVVYLI